MVTETDPYPGSLALLPVRRHRRRLVAGAEMTGRPALVNARWAAGSLFVGDASYSLYLWHWPVLAVIATQHVGRDLELARPSSRSVSAC